MRVEPLPTVKPVVPVRPTAPIKKSLALDVEMVTLELVPASPLLVAGMAPLLSNGEAVLAPLTPNATPAEFTDALRFTVMVIDPLELHMAYHVSRLLLGAA